MKQILTVLIILTFAVDSRAQNQMKPVEELIDLQEPAWEFVSQWIEEHYLFIQDTRKQLGLE